MRLASLLALISVAPVLHAQGIPGPLPEAYFPLSIGNRWVYEYVPLVTPATYQWLTVRGESTVSDTAYAVVESCSRLIQSSALPTCSTSLIRVDNASGEVRARAGNREIAQMCGLRPDMPSGYGPLACAGYNQWFVFAFGASEVQIGSQSVPTPSIRGLDGAVDGGGLKYAAGIGPLPGQPWQGWSTFLYARLGGIEYGVSPVAGESGAPVASVFALAAAPNPTAGALHLALTLPEAQTVAVEAFDALGRCVWQTAAALSAGPQTLTVDASAWAPGVYVVRATAGAASATARVVRR